MVKKLQEGSVWAKYDMDSDGTVTDEELSRATAMIELDLREEKADSQRRIAWVAMSAMVFYGLLPLLPFVSESRLGALADLGNILMLSCAGIVAAHFGATAMMAKK